MMAAHPALPIAARLNICGTAAQSPRYTWPPMAASTPMTNTKMAMLTGRASTGERRDAAK